jgi:ureidoglycolate lyase
MRIVRAIPLTAEAFTPYGDVVSAGLGEGRAANQGTAVRFDFAAALENLRPGARGNLAVFRSVQKTLPFEVKLLEKHPFSTQAFLPMKCSSYLICVAPALTDGTPDLSGLLAFQCLPGQGINYKRDTWHHPIIALDEPGEFAMLAWEDGSPDDCVEHWLAEPIGIGLPD